MKKSSGSSHVIGVPVTSTAYAIEDTTRSESDRPAATKTGDDRLAVSLTHPSPYTSFGYKHSTFCTRPAEPNRGTGPQSSLLSLQFAALNIAMFSRQQGPGDPLGEQAGKTSSELQGPW